ncbi:MAG: RidA family protein [Oscillospiraceae bacterium]|nr:RidA family protein [Oscillospiraceae bacterium]
MKKELKTEKAPAAIGPYSQGIQANGFVFVSGQLPIDPATGAFAGEDISSQTHQALKNVRAVLAEAGAGLEDVVRVNVYLKDIGDFAAMNQVYAEYFSDPCPARAAVQVAAIPKDALLEIEVIAAL